jgi:hypothetical protein
MLTACIDAGGRQSRDDLLPHGSPRACAGYQAQPRLRQGRQLAAARVLAGLGMRELKPPRSVAQLILGDNPVQVVLRLAILSLVVGIILSSMGYTSIELLQNFRFKLEALVKFGEWLVTSSFGFIIVGAAVVVPIWAIARLVRVLFGRKQKS